jgi:hypothetical protein
MGYDADVEPSLQIRRLDDLSLTTSNPESDVTIYDLNPTRKPRTTPAPAGAAEMVLTLPEALFGEPLSEKEYSAVKIYALKPGRVDRGNPVAWIELLSPSNKPGGRDAQAYFDKRLTVLENGVVFIEIDYLHESAPTLKGIPNYRRRRGTTADEEARAYRIIVVDPRPNFDEGIVRVHEFDVDAPFPLVAIPLNEEDIFQFDFGIAYRKTFEETLYGLQLVDYHELPLHFDRYSESDQARIANRMLAVLEVASQGLELESTPFPTHQLELSTALEQIEALKAK